MKVCSSRFSHSRRSVIALAAAMLVGSGYTVSAEASTWPSRPIRLVIGFAPGGGTDIMARSIAPVLSEKLGQTVIVENKPGASGNIAVAEAAKSAPDGYTFLLAPTTVETANPYMFKFPVNPATDLTPLTTVGRTQMYMLARPNFELENVEQFIQAAKTNPEKFSIASSGAGTAPHLAAEMLNQHNGSSITLVPYKGSAPALQDVMAGHADIVFDPGIGFPHIQSGKVKLLAVASDDKSSFFPDAPSYKDLGIKNAGLDIWFGLWSPNQLPTDISTRFASAVEEALTSPAVKERFAQLGAEPLSMDQQAFKTLLTDEANRLSTLIKERNIVAE